MYALMVLLDALDISIHRLEKFTLAVFSRCISGRGQDGHPARNIRDQTQTP